MSRIPLIAKHDDLPADQQHFFDRIVRTRGRVAGPYQVLLNSPDLAERTANVGEIVLHDTILPPAVKTLVWLIAAREYDCDHAWAACVPHARGAGISDAAIDAIASRQPLQGSSKEQELLVDFCFQLLRGNHHVSSATYAAAVEHFGVPATVQIAVTIGYFAMQACVLNAFELPPPAGDSGLQL
jgi:4-carboxymuconolactone decarboxylase